MEVQVVVPCYNEQDRLDRARFVQFLASQPHVHFLFVNDGSTDATGSLLTDMQDHNPGRMRVLHLPHNMGKAEAVRRGMLEAIDLGPDAAGYWDADLSTPLDAIPQFAQVLERRQDVRLVLGTRILLLGRTIKRRPLRQKLGRLFARTASWVLGLPVYDTQCGAKLMRADAASRLLFQEPFISRWIFDVEMLMRWCVLRRRQDKAVPHGDIYELPLEHWREVPGSKLRGGDFVRAIGELWRIWTKYSGRGALNGAPKSANQAGPDTESRAA